MKNRYMLYIRLMQSIRMQPRGVARYTWSRLPIFGSRDEVSKLTAIPTTRRFSRAQFFVPFRIYSCPLPCIRAYRRDRAASGVSTWL